MYRYAIASLSLFFTLIVAASISQAVEPGRQRLLMDPGWKFNLGTADTSICFRFPATSCTRPRGSACFTSGPARPAGRC